MQVRKPSCIHRVTTSMAQIMAFHQVMLKNPIAVLVAVLLGASSALAETSPSPAASARVEAIARPFVLDMVHHNPGEPETSRIFLDPVLLKSWGATATCRACSSNAPSPSIRSIPPNRQLGRSTVRLRHPSAHVYQAHETQTPDPRLLYRRAGVPKPITFL